MYSLGSLTQFGSLARTRTSCYFCVYVSCLTLPKASGSIWPGPPTLSAFILSITCIYQVPALYQVLEKQPRLRSNTILFEEKMQGHT